MSNPQNQQGTQQQQYKDKNQQAGKPQANEFSNKGGSMKSDTSSDKR